MAKMVYEVIFEKWNDKSIDGVDDHWISFTDRIYIKSEDAYKYVFETLCDPDGYNMDKEEVDRQLKMFGSVKYFTDEEKGISHWLAVRPALLFE